MSNDNQSPHKTGRLTSRGKNTGPSEPEIKPQKDSDEVLGAIAGVEKQLDTLRIAHEEQRKLSAELAAQRAQIEESSDQIESREAELASREVELAEMREDIESRETEIAQRASGIEQRESKVAQHAESIEELEAVVETKSRQIDQRVEELDKQLEGISVRKDELAKLEQQARERIQQDNELESKIEQLAKELTKTKASLGGREIELKERAKNIEDIAVQAGLLEQQVDELKLKAQADEESSLKLIEEMQTQIDDAEHKIESNDEAMRRALDRIDELESTISSKSSELENASKVISELNASEHSHDLATKKIKELQSKLKNAPTHKQLQTLQDLLVKATSELESAQANSTDLQSQLNAIGSGAAEEIESSKAQITSLNDQLGKSESALKDALAGRDQIQSDLQARLDQALASSDDIQSNSEESQRQIEDLQRELGARDEQIATSRVKYDELEAKLQREESISAEFATKARESSELASKESSEAMARLGELLDASKEREQQLTTQLEEITELLDSASSINETKTDEWTAARRTRLNRVKSILRQQSDKVRRATEALRDRYDQCEKVLLKRAELVDAYQSISEAQARLAKKEARSGTLLGLSGLGLVIMMIAGVSWFIAGQVAPGQYASSVTISASSGERTLTQDDLASWQGYIEQLAGDPQFVEQAASRMKRRGITELAIAGTLGAHMDQFLDVTSAESGKVVFDYRGSGPARTQRVLETYALTLTSQANASRARRADGAMTVIDSPVSAGAAPLDTARIETAGMIFGGSSLATFIFGGIFWRRLAKVKANFERDSRVEPLFDEGSWDVGDPNA